MKELRNLVTYITIVLMMAFLLSPSFAPASAASPQTFYAHSENEGYEASDNEMDQRTPEPTSATYNRTPSTTGAIQLYGNNTSTGGRYFTAGWPNSETITSGTWTFYTWLQMAEGTATYEVRVFKNADASAQFTSSTAPIPSSWTAVSTTGSAPAISMTAGDRLRFEYWADISALPSQARKPASAQSAYSGTWDITTNMGSYVDDSTTPSGHDSDTTKLVHGTTAGYLKLNLLSSFSVPSSATITNVSVFVTHRKAASQANKIAGSIWVGGVQSNGTPEASPVNGTYNTTQWSWTTNPQGGSWTPDQVNGVAASNNLENFGTNSSDANPAVYITQVYVEVNYRVPVSIRVDDNATEGVSTRVDTTVSQLVPALGYYFITLAVVFFLLVAIRRKVLVLGRGGTA